MIRIVSIQQIFTMSLSEPFIQHFSPNLYQSFTDGLELTLSDKMMVLHNETHKIPNPENHSFIGYPVEFLAYRLDDNGKIESITFFLQQEDDFLDKLKLNFGENTVVMEVTAGIVTTSNSQDFTYSTIDWVENNYLLTVAPRQNILMENEGSPSYSLSVARIWIYRLQ